MKQATSQAASDGCANVVSVLTSYSWDTGDRAVSQRCPRGSAVPHTSTWTVPAQPQPSPTCQDMGTQPSPAKSQTRHNSLLSQTYNKVFLLAIDLHCVDGVEGWLSWVLPLGLSPRKTPSQAEETQTVLGVSHCPKPPRPDSHLKGSQALP